MIDPYGETIDKVRQALVDGYKESGGMSEDEFHILVDLGNKLKELDSAISLAVPNGS